MDPKQYGPEVLPHADTVKRRLQEREEDRESGRKTWRRPRKLPRRRPRVEDDRG